MRPSTDEGQKAIAESCLKVLDADGVSPITRLGLFHHFHAAAQSS